MELTPTEKELVLHLRRRQKPAQEPKLDSLMEEFAQCIGLQGPRDKDLSKFRIFKVLIKEKEQSSEDLSQKLNLSRATVLHHIETLMKRGIIVRERRSFRLSSTSLFDVTNEMERQMDEFFEELKDLAKRIDEEL